MNEQQHGLPDKQISQ